MSPPTKYTPPERWERLLLGLLRRPSTLLVLLSIAFGVWAATARAAGFDVTHTPLVQRDLTLAESYWHKAAPCAALSVVVQPVGLVTGNNGHVVDGIASTALYGCEIDISPELWRADFLAPVRPSAGHTLRQSIELQRADSCADIEHEYGHAIGLPDMAGAGIMDASGPVGDALNCLRAFVPARVLRTWRFVH